MEERLLEYPGGKPPRLYVHTALGLIFAHI